MRVFRINRSLDNSNSDKGLRDKLNKHVVTPPSYIWDNIEERLPRQQKRRPIFFWLPLAACLALLSGVGLYMHKQENASSIQARTANISEKNAINKEALTGSINKKKPTTQNFSNNSSTKKHNSQQFTNGLILDGKPYSTSNKSTTYKKEILKHSNDISGQNLKTQNTDVNFGDKIKSENEDSKLFEYSNSELLSAKQQKIDSINIDTLIAESKQVNNPVVDLKTHTADKSDLTNKGKKWAFGVSSSFGSSYRKVLPSFSRSDEVTPNATASKADINYNYIESPGLALSAGLSVRYSLNKKWKFESGINFHKLTIQSKVNATSVITRPEVITNNLPETTYVQQNTTGNFSYENTYSLMEDNLPVAQNTTERDFVISEQTKVSYKFNFIDIPLLAQYTRATEKFGWQIKLGPSVRFLTTKKAIYNTANSTRQMSLAGNTYKPVSLNFAMSGGIILPFKNLSFELGPSINFALTPLMQSEIKTYMYTGTLQCSVYYSF